MLNWPAEKIETANIIIEETERIEFSDPILPLAIAIAESGLDPKAKNPSSSAFGSFQFLDGTFARHCQGSKKDNRDNVRCGIKLIARGDLFHWDASFEYWYRSYVPAFIKAAKLRHGVI